MSLKEELIQDIYAQLSIGTPIKRDGVESGVGTHRFAMRYIEEASKEGVMEYDIQLPCGNWQPTYRVTMSMRVERLACRACAGSGCGLFGPRCPVCGGNG